MALGTTRLMFRFSSKAPVKLLSVGFLTRTSQSLAGRISFSNSTTTTLSKFSPPLCTTAPHLTRSYSEQVDNDPGGTHVTSNFDKKILVWTKYYSKLEDVPDSVSYSKMKRAKDVFRIRVNIWMAVWTVIGCIGFIYVGRRQAKGGDSVHKQNLKWHEEQNKGN